MMADKKPKNRIRPKSVWDTENKDPNRPGHAHPMDPGAKMVFGQGQRLPTTNMSGDVVEGPPPPKSAPDEKPEEKKKTKKQMSAKKDTKNPWRK